jgi:IS66 C-terminal element
VPWPDAYVQGLRKHLTPVPIDYENSGKRQFAGADSGGERAAKIYSLLGTAKLNGSNPQAFLTHVLTHIADHPVNRVGELPPWNVAAAINPEEQKLAA